jgi:Mrp family chromosome partitioning ATPase
VNGLSFVSAGSESVHSSELLTNASFEKFIKQARESFDYVIIDSVPMGVFSDAASIGRYADINIIVVRMRYSKTSQLKAINKLAHEGVMQNLILVLNDVSDETAKKQLKGYGYE